MGDAETVPEITGRSGTFLLSCLSSAEMVDKGRKAATSVCHEVAVKMRAGPSASACTSRCQTALSGCSLRGVVVNVKER